MFSNIQLQKRRESTDISILITHKSNLGHVYKDVNSETKLCNISNYTSYTYCFINQLINIYPSTNPFCMSFIHNYNEWIMIYIIQLIIV